MTKEQAKEALAKLGDYLTPEQKQVYSAALDNEKFLDSVSEWGMLKADYSRNKNELAAERKRQEQEYADKYSKLEEWAKQYGTTLEEAKKVHAVNQKYRELYGELNGDAPAKPAASGPTLEEITKLLDEREKRLAQGVGSFVKTGLKLSNDYYKRFQETFDVDAFEQYLDKARETDPQLTIDQAYRSYIDPKLEERRTAEVEARIKAAKDEAVKDYASKHRLPLDPPAEKARAPVWDQELMEKGRQNPYAQEEKGETSFFEGWAEAASANR